MRIIVIAVTCVFVASETTAQVAARSFDDLARLVEPGDTVRLTDRSGHEETVRIEEVSTASLIVVAKERTRVLAEPDVLRIRRTSGATKKGALIGAAAALSVSLFVAAAWSNGEGFCSVCLGAGAIAGVPLGAGIGAGVGFGISLARRPTIYLASDRMDAR